MVPIAAAMRPTRRPRHGHAAPSGMRRPSLGRSISGPGKSGHRNQEQQQEKP